MSGDTKEWIVFGSFFVLLLVAVLGEIAWLSRSGRTTSSKALAFVLVTDLIGWIVGGIIGSMIAFGMFMVVMGPAGRGSEGNEGLLWGGTVGLALIPPAILFFSKRIFLAIFKISSGGAAWLYSFIASMLIFVIALVPPGLVAYFL